jgi:hypothetical protein
VSVFAWLEQTSLAMWIGLSDSFFAYPLILLLHFLSGMLFFVAAPDQYTQTLLLLEARFHSCCGSAGVGPDGL